jgi:hypothetical protein
LQNGLLTPPERDVDHLSSTGAGALGHISLKPQHLCLFKKKRPKTHAVNLPAHKDDPLVHQYEYAHRKLDNRAPNMPAGNLCPPRTKQTKVYSLYKNDWIYRVYPGDIKQPEIPLSM